MAWTTNGCDELRRATRRLALIHGAAWFFVLLQIFFVDLLLGADNTVINALACSHLPRRDARRAIMFGAGGAEHDRSARVPGREMGTGERIDNRIVGAE